MSSCLPAAGRLSCPPLQAGCASTQQQRQQLFQASCSTGSAAAGWRQHRQTAAAPGRGSRRWTCLPTKLLAAGVTAARALLHPQVARVMHMPERPRNMCRRRCTQRAESSVNTIWSQGVVAALHGTIILCLALHLILMLTVKAIESRSSADTRWGFLTRRSGWYTVWWHHTAQNCDLLASEGVEAWPKNLFAAAEAGGCC